MPGDPFKSFLYSPWGHGTQMGQVQNGLRCGFQKLWPEGPCCLSLQQPKDLLVEAIELKKEGLAVPEDSEAINRYRVTRRTSASVVWG